MRFDSSISCGGNLLASCSFSTSSIALPAPEIEIYAAIFVCSAAIIPIKEPSLWPKIMILENRGSVFNKAIHSTTSLI
jgi:hypothetical protein